MPLQARQAVSRCLPRSLHYRLSMKWVNDAIRWDGSRVFCIPNSNEAFFRLNLRGREPAGIVEHGPESEDVVAAVREQLEELKNPRNGARVAERISTSEHAFPGAMRGDLPDLMVSWDAAARIGRELATPRLGEIAGSAAHEVSPFYTGNHRPNAFVLARGPGLSAGSSCAGGHILDLAPSVLQLLGVEPPDHFEGRAWSIFA